MAHSQGFEAFEAWGYAWQATPAFADVVKSDARAGAPSPTTEIVKTGPAREVWRFQAATAQQRFDVFVKKCLLPEARDRLKYVFRPAKAWKEWKTLLELRHRGVAVPEPLAVGVARSGALLSSSILITKTLTGVAPLDAYVLGHIDSATHAEVAVFTAALADFLRRIHEAGVLHRDFHAANIMVAQGPSGPQFSLVDLADVHVGRGLLAGERLENIAVLGHFFCQVAPRHWRLRFLKGYLADAEDYHSASRLVEHLAEKGMRRIWAKRDRRIFGENKYFRQVHTGRLSGHMRRAPAAAAAVSLFEDNDSFDKADSIIKDSRSSKVGVFSVDLDGQARKILVKRRNPRHTWKALFDPFRISRGKKGFFFGAAFANRLLPTPPVLAVLDERRFGVIRASYAVFEYIEGAENLAALAAARGAGGLSARLRGERGAFLRRLAHVLRRMHWCGFSARDLKAANILIYERAGRLEFAISDLDGARLYPGGVPERVAIRNIARLYFDASWLGAVTRREAIDFLKDYLGPASRERTSKWVSGISRFVRTKRQTFKPKGIFAASPISH